MKTTNKINIRQKNEFYEKNKNNKTTIYVQICIIWGINVKKQWFSVNFNIQTICDLYEIYIYTFSYIYIYV